MGQGEYVAQPNVEYKNQATSKRISKTATVLRWLQSTYAFPLTGEAQCCDGGDVIEIGTGNHIGTVTELCIATAIFC